MLATLFVIMIVKPLGALLMTSLFRKPLKLGLPVAASLSQVGEFTFILAGLGISLGVFDQRVNNALIPAAIISITFNPMLYRKAKDVALWWEKRKRGNAAEPSTCLIVPDEGNRARVVVVGYGPVGRSCCRILQDSSMLPVVVEMNIDTVRLLRSEGVPVGARRCHAGRSTARSWPGKGRSPAVDIPQYPRRRSDAHSARGESSCAHFGAHGLCERSPLPAR